VTTQVKDNNHVLFHLILVLLSFYIANSLTLVSIHLQI
jgi:hypothetical protein